MLQPWSFVRRLVKPRDASPPSIVRAGTLLSIATTRWCKNVIVQPAGLRSAGAVADREAGGERPGAGLARGGGRVRAAEMVNGSVLSLSQPDEPNPPVGVHRCFGALTGEHLRPVSGLLLLPSGAHRERRPEPSVVPRAVQRDGWCPDGTGVIGTRKAVEHIERARQSRSRPPGRSATGGKATLRRETGGCTRVLVREAARVDVHARHVAASNPNRLSWTAVIGSDAELIPAGGEREPEAVTSLHTRMRHDSVMWVKDRDNPAADRSRLAGEITAGPPTNSILLGVARVAREPER